MRHRYISAAALLLLACRLASLPQPASSPSAGGVQSPTTTTTTTPTRTATPASSVVPGPALFDTTWDDRSIFRSALVTSEQQVLDDDPGASVYHLDLAVSDDLSRVGGREEVRYTNRESVALDEVKFRLYPNILGGAMTVSELRVNGEKVEPSYELSSSVMTVPLPEPLKPGEQSVISMSFDVSVPAKVEQNYGVLSSADGVLAYAHGYPLIAVFNDSGWNVEFPADWGDLTFGDASYFLARITAPEGLQIAASGSEISREIKAGDQVLELASGPARDFSFDASKAYEVSARDVGEVKIRVFGPAADAPRAQSALDVAEAALEVYSQRYGPYPYSELDFALTPTYALGIEYPGIIALNERLFTPAPELEGVVPESVLLESTVAHEVAHQWFYNIVGNDQLDEPWLDESLAQFATWQYYRDAGGPVGAAAFEASLEARWAGVDSQPIPVGLPVRDYDPLSYGAIVYGRGALFLEALKEEMGNDRFDSFMQDYGLSNRWKIATTASFKALAEQHCACDLSALFDEWIYP